MTDQICKISAGTRVLVTGATGFTGIVLTRKLVDAGLDVSAVARSTSNLEPFEGLPITWFRGEVFDESVIHEAMQGQEYVFHVAAAFREAKSSERDYWNVHVKSTQLIAEKIPSIPGFKRLIHVSTFGVHGHIENPPATEESPFSPGDGYQRTKLEAELWLKEYAQKNNINYTIIRPAAIYGPGDKRLLKLFKMATQPFFPLLGKGKCMYHLVHVDDLTDAILIAATHPKAQGEEFVIGGDEAIPIAELAGIISRHFGSKIRIVRLPIGPFFLLADICEKICQPLKIEPPLYRRRVAFYSKDRHFDVSKMRNTLGFTPRYSNEKGVIQTADWYVENGYMKK